MEPDLREDSLLGSLVGFLVALALRDRFQLLAFLKRGRESERGGREEGRKRERERERKREREK